MKKVSILILSIMFALFLLSCKSNDNQKLNTSKQNTEVQPEQSATQSDQSE